MANEVVLPRQGWTMEVGSIVEWLKHDGDVVKQGEILFTLQSDKAINEIEALESGILRIPSDSPAPGVEVPIGTVLAYILQPGEVLTFEGQGEGVLEIAQTAGTPSSSPSPRGRRDPAVPVNPRRDATAPAGPARSDPAPQGQRTTTLERPRPETTITPSRARLLALYREMLVIRRTEEALARLHQQGLVHGACHTYVGQEAIATGVCAHLETTDSIFSTHRGHGHALAKGVSPAEVIAELLGRATGCSGGRGGSMHLFKPEVGLLGTSGIVGPSILLASGAAYAFKLNKTGGVAVAFFGDGASNNGAFHEGINMATVWDLPVIFICENNQYATEIAHRSVSRVVDVATKAAGYGLPGISVDGNDVMRVYEVAGEAIRRARAGGGPTLIECKTYRTRAHSEGMRADGYRTQAEIDSWKERDPLPSFAAQLLDARIVTRDELNAIAAEVEKIVAEAVEFAKNSPWPDPATVADHVYA